LLARRFQRPLAGRVAILRLQIRLRIFILREIAHVVHSLYMRALASRALHPGDVSLGASALSILVVILRRRPPCCRLRLRRFSA
jgi:hypothetical protein